MHFWKPKWIMIDYLQESIAAISVKIFAMVTSLQESFKALTGSEVHSKTIRKSKRRSFFLVKITGSEMHFKDVNLKLELFIELAMFSQPDATFCHFKNKFSFSFWYFPGKRGADPGCRKRTIGVGRSQNQQQGGGKIKT